MNGEIPGLYKMKPDYGFALVCWSMVLGPAIIVIATGNPWFLLLYFITVLVFGLA